MQEVLVHLADLSFKGNLIYNHCQSQLTAKSRKYIFIR